MPARRLPLVGLLLLLLGACPPGKDGDTATDAGGSSGGPATTTGGSTGPVTGATSDMSSGTSSTTTTGDATTDASSSSSTTTDATTGSSTTGRSTTSDATTGGTTTGGTTTGGASTFFCDACLCDAATTYCRKVLAGLVDIPPDPPMCPVVPQDPLNSGCVPYPEACGDTPTCDCIPNLNNNNCFCEESMGTFTLTCPLP